MSTCRTSTRFKILPLHPTEKLAPPQDLFTLGEYLCEESNCLYKMIRLFSYDVPTGEDKRALMALGRSSIDYPNDENT